MSCSENQPKALIHTGGALVSPSPGHLAMFRDILVVTVFQGWCVAIGPSGQRPAILLGCLQGTGQSPPMKTLHPFRNPKLSNNPGLSYATQVKFLPCICVSFTFIIYVYCLACQLFFHFFSWYLLQASIILYYPSWAT